MKKTYLQLFALAAIISLALLSCKKTNDKTVFNSYSNYTNLAVGKYIIYAIDSTVTRSFGTSFIVSSNIVKDSVMEEIVDNSNRKTFKVFRYQLDAVHNTWKPVNTFYFTPTDNTLEYVENNQRYIKLVSPVENDKSWFGNTFLGIKLFHDNSSYQDWNFYYKDAGQPQHVGSFDFDNTVTVVQYDSANNTPFLPYAPINTYEKGYEIYAANVGLVYRDVMSWEYQSQIGLTNCKHTFPTPNGTGTSTASIDCNNPDNNCDSLARLANHKIACDTVITEYHYNGYGTKQVMLSHN